MMKMKMKRILILLLTVTVVFLISSCATTSPSQKYLIGTWKPVNIEKYNLPVHSRSDAGNEGKTNPGTKGTTSSSDKDRQTYNERKQNAREELRSSLTFYSDNTSSLTFKANKTAIKESEGKTVNAKWKLTNHGTRLQINRKEPAEITTYDIIQINDTTAVVSESFSVLSMRITFKKVKK